MMTVTPVYPPFLTAPANQGRRLIAVPATVSGGRWRLPLEAMEAAVTPETRVFLLCHPHNPLGRVWCAEELARCWTSAGATILSCVPTRSTAT